MTTPLIESPFLVPSDGSFRLSEQATSLPEGHPASSKRRKQLAQAKEALDELQHRFFADGSQALLLVFQAMDAAGKDSTIRRVLSGLNPAGFRVHGFGAPSALERSHDFLWRLNTRLPERGRIGVFNRSHYEEVLIVRIKPGFLAGQGIDPSGDLDALFAERFQAIRDWERRLKHSKTTVVKFFLNVSKEEQRKRLLARLDEPAKNWKFEGGDLETRAQWDQYMAAYQGALNETSTADAPWFCIPADDKKSMRVLIAQHLVKILTALNPQYPTMPAEERAKMDAYRAILEGQA